MKEGGLAPGRPTSGTGDVILIKFIYKVRRNCKDIGMMTMWMGMSQSGALLLHNAF